MPDLWTRVRLPPPPNKKNPVNADKKSVYRIFLFEFKFFLEYIGVMAWIEKAKNKKGITYYVRYSSEGKNQTYGKYPTKKLANEARLECEVQLSQQKQEDKKIALKLSELWKLYQERKLDVRASTLKRYNQQLNNWNDSGDLLCRKRMA